MNHWLIQHARDVIQNWGYWAVFVGVMLESAGLPCPGETVIILASVLAKTEHMLDIRWIGMVAGAAAITGDNIGYWIGKKGGCKLLDRYSKFLHVSEESIHKGESLMKRRGPAIVYFARFITYLRIIAGPLAGVLHMEWRKFLLWNALGGLTWVAGITSLAYIFGPALTPALRNGGWVILGTLGLWVLVSWIRHHRQPPSNAAGQH